MGIFVRWTATGVAAIATQPNNYGFSPRCFSSIWAYEMHLTAAVLRSNSTPNAPAGHSDLSKGMSNEGAVRVRAIFDNAALRTADAP